MKKITSVKKNWVVVVLILVSSLPLLDLLHVGLPLTHDGQDHVARIANFYQNLKEGVVVPRWAGNLNWGYGHPILMFLYPIPSYITSFFHFLGFSLVDSVKIVFGLAFIASGLTMYLWIRSFLNQGAGFIAAILYMFAPYRLIDLYTRGAIGEHVAFVFPPLILYFLLKNSKRKSYWYLLGGVFSLACLILSHNAISLMFLPIIGLYILYLYFQTKIKRSFLMSVLLIIFFGFLLSTFFWMPALFEGHYTLRDKIIAGGYSNRFIPLVNLFIDPFMYDGIIPFSMQVGIVQWVIVFLSPFILYYLYKKKNFLWFLVLILLGAFCVSVFFILEPSRVIWKNLQLLQNFQFPWRFLSVVVFVTSALGAIICFQLPRKVMSVAIVFIVVSSLFLTNTLWHPKAFLSKPENFYTNVYFGTTDTGESAPIWSVRFMERVPKAEIEIIEGAGEINKIKRTSTYHKYEIQAKGTVRVLENTLFFPGWEVRVNRKPVLLQFQDPQYRGLMTFFLPGGNNTVEVIFRDTKLRMIANGITIGSIVLLGIVGIFFKKNLFI